MLEDESGRVLLVGDRISSACLVTGVIIGALGIETNSGEFEVIDLCYPGMAPQLSASLPWSPTKVSDQSMDIDGQYCDVAQSKLLLTSTVDRGGRDRLG